jgi:hypothetical protein
MLHVQPLPLLLRARACTVPASMRASCPPWPLQRPRRCTIPSRSTWTS